jgi:alkyldihydroxyacetonephosphate synthase
MPIPAPSAPRVRLDAPDINSELVDQLASAGVEVSREVEVRADHGRDWWPLSIGWIVEGEVPSLPGVVVKPRNPAEVSRVLELAGASGVAVTVQGGRSGVVGGAVPLTGGIALDMTEMANVLEIDEISGTVTVEAGCFGPDLESALRARGLTVGHFPQSFDLATVGGWLACRGAGQYSNRYGKVEDIVRGLTVVLADGSVVKTGGRGPRQAVGPDLTQVFVGSEGTLGVIVEATLAAWPTPTFEARAAFSFDSFAEGLEACRRVTRRGAAPAVMRLYDERESTRSFDVDRCCLIVLDEGEEALVRATMSVLDEECADARGEHEGLVERWLSHRNDVSALAPLWQRGIVVDTIEVAGPWAALPAIHERVTSALMAVESTMVASTHQSHAYVDGACLYFTFAGRPETDYEDYYRRAWTAASAATLGAGGALSHHHGVGRNRARFVPDALGSSYRVLATIKGALDPDSIMNPGVLGLGPELW